VIHAVESAAWTDDLARHVSWVLSACRWTLNAVSACLGDAGAIDPGALLSTTK
jgi:hypothetical protein